MPNSKEIIDGPKKWDYFGCSIYVSILPSMVTIPSLRIYGRFLKSLLRPNTFILYSYSSNEQVNKKPML